MIASKRIDPYEATLRCAFTQSEWEACNARVGDTMVEKPNAGGLTSTTISPTGKVIVTVFIERADHRTDALFVNTLAHESAHAASGILGHVGQEHDGGSECFAYLVGFIAEWIWLQWQKRRTDA